MYCWYGNANDVSEGDEYVGSDRQKVAVDFHVLVVVMPHQYKIKDTYNDMETLIDSVNSALMGWTPVNAFEPLRFTSSVTPSYITGNGLAALELVYTLAALYDPV